MGSGCLAPKPLKGDLSMQLIQQLHKGVASTSRESKYMSGNIDYQMEKQKIYKKPPLRKLIDYLSAHRNKIVDSLSYNLKNCVSRGGARNWMIGLAVLQRVISMAGKNNQTSSKCIVLKESFALQQSQTYKSEPQTLKTQSDKENRPDYKGTELSSAEFIINEISSARFQAVLMDTITLGLQVEELYPQALRILCQYLSLRTKNIKAQEKAIALLSVMLQNLKVDYESSHTLEAYYRLSDKMRDGALLSLGHSLKQFVKLWLQYKAFFASSKDIAISNKYQSKVSGVESIITRFLISSMNSMQQKVMISLIMEINDQKSFGLPLQFQQFFVYVLNNYDLGTQFLKSLFLQYLNYAALGSSWQQSHRQFTNSARQLNRSLETASFRNIRDQKTRDNLYELIKRWTITKKYIPYKQIITYHSSLLIYCFLDRSIYQNNYLEVFLQIVKESSQQQYVIIVQTILQLYQREETPLKIRNSLLLLHKSLQSIYTQITLQTNISRISICQNHLSISERYQVYINIMLLYSKFDKQTLILHMQQIFQLFASFTSYFKEPQTDLKQSKQFINSIAVFLERIICVQRTIVAFYQKLIRIKCHKDANHESTALLQTLIANIEQIFKANNICDYDKEESVKQGDDQTDKCESYIKNFQYLQSKIGFDGKQTSNFEKLKSVMNSSYSPQQDQQSFRDVVEMINY